MQLPDEVVKDLRRRLKRAGGQVQAVEIMLGEGRECRDIMMQLSAATKALEQVGLQGRDRGFVGRPGRLASDAVPGPTRAA